MGQNLRYTKFRYINFRYIKFHFYVLTNSVISDSVISISIFRLYQIPLYQILLYQFPFSCYIRFRYIGFCYIIFRYICFRYIRFRYINFCYIKIPAPISATLFHPFPSPRERGQDNFFVLSPPFYFFTPRAEMSSVLYSTCRPHRPTDRLDKRFPAASSSPPVSSAFPPSIFCRQIPIAHQPRCLS